jgi:hypothetical protein
VATSWEDIYREQTHTGFWKLKIEDDRAMKWQLDVDAFVSDVLLRMRTIEDKITRDLVVVRLREMGYTITEPEGADDGNSR